MRPGLLLLLVLAVLAGALRARAEHRSLEVRGGSTAGLVLESIGSSDVTLWTIQGQVGFFLPANPMFEVSVTPSFTSRSVNGASSSEFSLLAGPVINFQPQRIEDSFYGYLGIGFFSLSSGGSSTSDFSFAVAAGKRFGLASQLAYTPEVQYQVVATSPSITIFRIVPLQFSFLL
jgi:hypothetical protein